MKNNSFNIGEEDLKYFEENIFDLIEYFYKNFYLMFKKYCTDIAVQLISDKKIECRQFNNFIENSIIKEAKIQEKNLQYINTSISNHIFIKNSILGDIDKFCNKYEKNFDDNTDFRILSLNSIFYENFYGQLLEYCGLKAPNYNKLGFKDITANDLIDKLVSSLQVSNETKKRMFKDITQKLSKNKNKKFANNKQLNTKKISIEKNIKKPSNQKQALQNNKDLIKKQLEQNEKKIKEIEKLKVKTKEIKVNNINLKTPNNFLSMNDKNIYLKEYIKEKTKDRKKLLNIGSKKQNNNKTINNEMNFNILSPLFKFGFRNLMLNNGLKLGINTAKNFGKIVGNIGNRINNIVNKKKVLNNLANKNIIKNKVSNKININIKNTIEQKKVDVKEVNKNREKLSKIKNARNDLDNRLQKSKSNGIGGIK